MSQTLEEIQDDILDRVHAGETIDEAAVCAAHPTHVEDLRAFFSVIALVEGSHDNPAIPPTRLGEYRIIEEIGRGGMGVVYAAEQTSLKRKVALKILPPMLRMDLRLIARFQREAEAAGRLRHPGIVPVYAVGEAAGTPFFAMELVEGTSLQQILNARKEGDNAKVPKTPKGWEAWAVAVAAKVADALAYAHQEGILHRDIKPANIMIDKRGEVRLTDFGLAQDLRSPGLTQTGEVFGSPQYMSPEQAMRRDLPMDGRSDVYSLAVTLYELLTQKLPYDGTTHAEVLTALTSGTVVPPRKVNPAISRPLEAVLLRALRLKPGDRYANAAAFAKDLRAASAGEPTASRAPLLSGTRARVLAATAAAIALGLGAWLFSTSNRGTDEPSSPTSTTQTGRVKYYDNSGAKAPKGKQEFVHKVPTQGLGYLGHPFLQAVRAASERRWFSAEEQDEFNLAQRAWQETQEHMIRMREDAKYRAVDEAIARVAKSKLKEGLHLRTRFVDPYLFCYVSKDPMSAYETLNTPGLGTRRALRTEAKARSQRVDAAIADYAKIHLGLYARYRDVLGSELGLKDLTRLPPMVVRIFESSSLFQENLLEMPASVEVVGFLDANGDVQAIDRDETNDKDRAQQIMKIAHEGTHQLNYWYTYKTSGARPSTSGANWLEEGWTEYLSAVRLRKDAKLRFMGWNAIRLRGLQKMASRLKLQGKKLPIFPLEHLTAFESFSEPQQWAATRWQLDAGIGIEAYYQQSWALVHFLAAPVSKYRPMFARAMKAHLAGKRPSEAFRSAFGIKSQDDPRWKTLNAEFRKHIDALLKFSTEQLDYKPAARGSFPTGADQQVVMTFELSPTDDGGRVPDPKAGTAALRTCEIILSRLHGIGVGQPSIKRINSTRFEIVFESLPVPRRDEIVQLVTRHGTIAFRIEILPDEEYRRDHNGDARQRTKLWPDSKAAFDEFKKREVAVWQAAQDHEGLYIPTRKGMRLVQRAGSRGETVADFRVVEDPAHTDHTFDGRMLASPSISQDHTGRPVVLFDVRSDWHSRFRDWTTANVGLPMAILVDGEYYSAPVINMPLDTSVQISLASQSREKAERNAHELVATLRAGALPLQPRLVLLEER